MKHKEVKFLILVAVLAIGGLAIKGFVYDWDWRCMLSGECRIIK